MIATLLLSERYFMIGELMPDNKATPVEEKNRIIYFSGPFTEDQARTTVTTMLKYETDDPTKDILLYIDSYGGSVDSFIAVHDAIQMCRCDIVTVCIGKAMSCGQMLLMSGKRGKRFITPNSRVLIHQIGMLTCGKLVDMDIDIQEGKRLQRIIERLILKYTKIGKVKLSQLMERDSFLSAEDALKLGLVDAIIHKPNDLYSRIKT